MLILRFADAGEPDLRRAIAVTCEHGELVHRVRLASEDFVVFEMEDESVDLGARLAELPRLVAAVRVETPYVLSARPARAGRSRVTIRPGLVVGGEEFVVMAGPCAVESEAQVRASATGVRASGARVLRGGAFKPRTSPFSFQGHGLAGVDLLARVGAELGLPIVSEALAVERLDEVIDRVDVLQVGMRNAQNFPLLSAIGSHPSRPPVLLKRGSGSSLDEFLCAADYILAGGNPNVILCLRGTMDRSGHSRASLNIADVPALRHATHLPILVDPSHAAGRRDLVPAMSAAALAAGADGLLVEVHAEPDRALVDGPQSLTLDGFDRMMSRLRKLAVVMGRRIGGAQGVPAKGTGSYRDLGLEGPSTPARAQHADAHGNLQV